MTLLKNTRKIYTLSLAALAVSVLVKMYFSNCLVTDNNHLNELFTKKNVLQKEISRLTYLENSLSALNVVEQRAVALGFTKMSSSLLSVEINSPSVIAYNTSN